MAVAKGDVTPKEQAFADHYLACWSFTEAARRTGIRDPRNGYSYFRNSKAIQRIIRARLREIHADADEVIARISDHARGSMGDFIVIKDGVPAFDMAKAEENGKLHLIKRMRVTKRRYKNADGEPEEEISTDIELYDAQAALDKLMRAHGAYKDGITLHDDTRVSKLQSELEIVRAERAKLEAPKTA